MIGSGWQAKRSGTMEGGSSFWPTKKSTAIMHRTYTDDNLKKKKKTVEQRMNVKVKNHSW